MSAVIVVEIIVGIVILVGAVQYAVRDARRRRQPDPHQFESEYEEVAQGSGASEAAQHASEAVDQPDRLDVPQLDPAARDCYIQRWEAVQAQFAEQPESALDEADRLVTDVMRDRSYPVENFDEHAEQLAADHPQLVEHYRAARACRHAHHGDSGASGTEDLRQAFEHYGVLFDELVHDRQAARP